MESLSLRKAALFTIGIIVLLLSLWEMYVRTRLSIAYDEGESIWADKRAQVYDPMDKATVFIGSSRNKFDLDIATWQSLTGEHAIQLAIVGSSPLPVLDDLANDPKFKGKMVVDVTEGLFFSVAEPNIRNPREYVAYYKKRTPAQRFSFQVNHLLESQFVFLDKNNLSLNALLDEVNIPDRPGVFKLPVFPSDFGRVSFERQNIMTARFEADSNLRNKVKSIWVLYGTLAKRFPTLAKDIDSIFLVLKADVDKIKARGGEIIFVRTPSSGPFLFGESKGFPRDKYWERILATTHCQGIHFADYPSTSHFQCPEFSHLKHSDAIIWTKNLVDILQHEKGWSFPHQPSHQ